MIKLGSIEYYALVELRDKLRKSYYLNLGLDSFDKLRLEVDAKIKSIHNSHKESSKK